MYRSRGNPAAAAAACSAREGGVMVAMSNNVGGRSGLPGDRSEEVGRAIVISCLRVAFGPAAELPSDALASRPIIPTNCDNHGDGPPPQRGPAGLLVSTAIGGPTPSRSEEQTSELQT